MRRTAQPSVHAPSPVDQRLARLLARFGEIRGATVALCAGLSAEDCALQSMPDASPVEMAPRAHQLVLRDLRPRSRGSCWLSALRHPVPGHVQLLLCPESGQRHPRAGARPDSRPAVAEVLRPTAPRGRTRWRRSSESRTRDLRQALRPGRAGAASRAAAPGAHPHRLQAPASRNPLRPVYRTAPARPQTAATVHRCELGVLPGRLARDRPRRGRASASTTRAASPRLARSFQLATRPVTNRRVPRLHRRWRLRAPASCGCRTAGTRAQRRMERAAVLGARRARVARVHACGAGTTSIPANRCAT